eukprot:m.218706 g.218706  ORF g.218706 m.218706 type:complete len:53 (-) comp29912_c0_seq1:166-324(-)
MGGVYMWRFHQSELNSAYHMPHCKGILNSPVNEGVGITQGPDSPDDGHVTTR